MTPPVCAQTALPAPRRLPAWKKVLFALTVLIVAALTLEMLLALAGVAPLDGMQDPYVRFAAYRPLFVESPGTSGRVMATAPDKRTFFNAQQFPREKGANTYRVFCLGGSTTYGHPYDDKTSFCGWLRRFLPAADPRRHWEVINAGGISYASYRVARLMEELVAYQPDLFVIYTGHNEFLERRSYGPLLSMPRPVRALGGVLSRTRSYAASARLIHHGRGREIGGSRSGPFLLPTEVTALLDQTAGPRDYQRDDRMRRQVVEHFRLNLIRMVQLARSAGAGVVLVVPASNQLDCSPFKSQHREGLTADQRIAVVRLLEQARMRLAAAEYAAALHAAEQGLQIDGRHAALHYVRGRILYRLGRYAQAEQALMRALEEDVCPLRALPEMEQVVRDVARTLSVPCIDFAAMIRSRSEGGISGRTLFLDHVHPTIEGNRLLGEALLRVMIEHGWVRPQRTWGPAVREQIAAELTASLDSRLHGLALNNVSRVLGWAGKLEEAAALSDQAVAMAPNDPETQFQAGVMAEFRNNLSDAERHYRRALQWDATFAEARINLGVVLGEMGRYAEAAGEFRAGLADLPQCEALVANVALAACLKGHRAAAIELQKLALEYAGEERRPALLDQLAEFEAGGQESGQ